ncbi:MAG: MMPL family transporter, partial [Phycisphaeraceae bacterium]|nr:MMPL family transporter [Phycisphaeraceae bacterium]
MTSITTAVGFVSLLTSQIYPIKYFGVFTAVGVLMAMVFSLVLLPAALLVFGVPKARRKAATVDDATKVRVSTTLTRGLLRHRVAVLLAAGAVIAASVVGAGQVWINSSFLDKFEADSDIVLTDKFINANFGGTSTLNVILDAAAPGTFKRPAVLKAVARMQAEVDGSLEVVGNSFSLADYLTRMNKVMHADEPAFNTIPDTSELVAQYLLLYEMSGDPENLWKVVDYEFQRANVTFQLKSDDSKALNATLAAVEQHRAALEAQGVHIKFAGSGYKGLVFTELILEGQVLSLALSLLIAIALLALMFKSVLVGIIGSVPIMVTAVIGFGILGWTGIPLSTTTALLSSIAVGIGIDYAVHFLERYRISARSTGEKEAAGAATMRHAGRAIVFNAVV